MKCQRDLSKKKKLKNMNSKLTRNSQLVTTEPKMKTNSANNWNRNRMTEMEITWMVWGGGRGRTGGKVQRMSSINGR